MMELKEIFSERDLELLIELIDNDLVATRAKLQKGIMYDRDAVAHWAIREKQLEFIKDQLKYIKSQL